MVGYLGLGTKVHLLSSWVPAAIFQLPPGNFGTPVATGRRLPRRRKPTAFGDSRPGKGVVVLVPVVHDDRAAHVAEHEPRECLHSPVAEQDDRVFSPWGLARYSSASQALPPLAVWIVAVAAGAARFKGHRGRSALSRNSGARCLRASVRRALVACNRCAATAMKRMTTA